MIENESDSEIFIGCSLTCYLSKKTSFMEFEGVWGELHPSQLILPRRRPKIPGQILKIHNSLNTNPIAYNLYVWKALDVQFHIKLFHLLVRSIAESVHFAVRTRLGFYF